MRGVFFYGAVYEYTVQTSTTQATPSPHPRLLRKGHDATFIGHGKAPQNPSISAANSKSATQLP